MKIYILGGINSYHYGDQYSRLDRLMRKESDPSRILIGRIKNRFQNWLWIKRGMRTVRCALTFASQHLKW